MVITREDWDLWIKMPETEVVIREIKEQRGEAVNDLINETNVNDFRNTQGYIEGLDRASTIIESIAQKEEPV